MTQDIKPDWLRLVRRLQSVARKQTGYAIVTVSIMIDSDGIPQFFTEPEVTRLEPRLTAIDFLNKLIYRMRRG